MKSYITKAFPFQPIQIFSEKAMFHPNINLKTREVILPILSMWSANTRYKKIFKILSTNEILRD